ncbi:hypothetical protein CROQUDRAFT_45779 [Cronartium quercuum f. sp. fusiforme G11]|uniref:Carboxylesterase type B domain-containing protein n=1 Tax=Cronartium quercuum f. sp. fusiforme G11 TaxID=708437 RepID=A0A9P6TCA7_9BASI|nr:hypothetical protein CROQUDRAFT_45779 [Cronartium quercuum f. sp. fusiforme G11]
MAQPHQLLVDTTSGPVLGFQDTFPISDRSTASVVGNGKVGSLFPVNKWLGIPYAQAARWKRPTPPKSWNKPLVCHEFGPDFPQISDPVTMLYSGQPGFHARSWKEQSEEKGFSLNIFLPSGLKPGDQAPVLVWICGGALTNGSGSTCIYDPTEWIRREATKNCKFIVVTGNYRVNIFGFLAGSELAAEDEDGLSGNYGLYDCIEYLQWVQNNIAKFGGDPDNVTAFGESAGASIIGALFVCKKKLFRNAILQSGSPGTMRFHDAEAANSTYEEICEKAGKATPGPDRIAALRALPASELLKYHPPGLTLTLSFAVESSPKAIWSTMTVTEILKQGAWNPHIKAVILGVNKDEGSYFAHILQSYTPEGYDNMCKIISNKPSRDVLNELYTPSFSNPDSTAPFELTNCPGARLMNESLFKIPMEFCANVLSSTKHCESAEKLKVYVYQLNTTLHGIELGRVLGAFHSVDIPFVFNMKELWSEESANARTSELVGKYWYSLAKSGYLDPIWPQYNPKVPVQKHFEADGGSINRIMGRKSDNENARYKFWSQFC